MQRNGLAEIKRGVNFHECFGKKIRKICSNKIVLKAVEDLNGSSELEEWDISSWGYLTWETVEKFCERNNMTDTLENFEHNWGKIY